MIGFAFFLGLLLGSFFNVVVYRLPRGISVVFPRSHCPHCQHVLHPVDLIPVVSFVLVRGRCRYCGAPISFRYVGIELGTALIFALVWVVTGDLATWASWSAFFSLLLILSVIDLEHMFLPDTLTVGGMVLGFLLAGANLTIPLQRAVLGALIGTGLIFIIVTLSRGGMGMGDAKLLGLVGTFLGPWGAVGALFWGSVLGSIIGVTLILGGRHKRRDPVPFGPFLSLGALIMWLSGDSGIQLLWR